VQLFGQYFKISSPSPKSESKSDAFTIIYRVRPSTSWMVIMSGKNDANSSLRQPTN